MPIQRCGHFLGFGQPCSSSIRHHDHVHDRSHHRRGNFMLPASMQTLLNGSIQFHPDGQLSRLPRVASVSQSVNFCIHRAVGSHVWVRATSCSRVNLAPCLFVSAPPLNFREFSLPAARTPNPITKIIHKRIRFQINDPFTIWLNETPLRSPRLRNKIRRQT